MNLELTDEQAFLRDAARDALSRVSTVAAAREALEDLRALPSTLAHRVRGGLAGPARAASRTAARG